MPGTRGPKRQTRFPVRAPAVSEPLEVSGSPEVGEAQNLSQGGVLLRLGKALAPGVPVRVTLRLRRRSPLVLTGTVAWIRPHLDLPGWAVGMRFDQALSEELVVEIADEEYPPWEVGPTHPAKMK